MLDRFDVMPILVDHVRSTRDARTDKADVAARVVLFGSPLLVAAVSFVAHYTLTKPDVVAPVAGLLAGVLFGAVGQLISVRARIADSVTLSSSSRLKQHFRESISGLLLASLASLMVALLCAVLALMPQSNPALHPWLIKLMKYVDIGGTALVLALTTFTVLMFFKMVRRVYASYLEAFEGGRFLSKHDSKKPVDPTSTGAAEHQPGNNRNLTPGRV